MTLLPFWRRLLFPSNSRCGRVCDAIDRTSRKKPFNCSRRLQPAAALSKPSIFSTLCGESRSPGICLPLPLPTPITARPRNKTHAHGYRRRLLDHHHPFHRPHSHARRLHIADHPFTYPLRPQINDVLRPEGEGTIRG